MRIKTTITIFACLIIVIAAPPAWGASGGGEYTPTYREGEVLVKFRPESGERDRGRARDLVRTQHVKKYKHVRIEKLTLDPGTTAAEAVALLRSNPGVEYAEFNWRMRYLVVPRLEPGDPRYLSGEQWHLDAPPLTGYYVDPSRPVLIDRDIDAPEAWAVMSAAFTSRMSGAVGVIDSGCGELGYFDSSTGYIPNHEDLPNDSLWANEAELATLGVDDDSNGYVDDVNGYDFWYGDNAMDDDYWPHGTFISGIIVAAWGNGLGGVGVGMNSLKVLPLKTAFLADTIESIEYAIDMATAGDPPIRVLNASWTFSLTIDQLQPLQEAIELAGAAGIVFVAAASNEGNNNDQSVMVYPAEYTKVPIDNVLAVAASDSTGGLAYFSNYGPNSVQIAAPGHEYLSVYMGDDQYTSDSGTSFAAPVAASALALIMSVNPGLTPAEAIDRLIDGGDFDARLSGLIRSGKRVNLAGALAPFAPYSGYAPMDTRQPLTMYTDTVSTLYGSITSAVSDSPSVAVMVALPGGAWAVSPVSPGLTTFTLEFDGASAPVGTYETGTWRVTGISPFFAQISSGQSMDFTSLIPYSTLDWSVTDSTIGTIDSGGVFTALNEGTTRIVLNVDGRDIDNSGIILVVIDGDGDGYEGGEDCDDSDPYVYPGAPEICDDGIDNDCDGNTDTDDSHCIDNDADGYMADVDCDDTEPDANPGATEICDDGIDNDCDGDVDTDDSHCRDSDGDGYMADVDCDDTDPDVNPGADEICGDGIDNDCDGNADDEDSDCETDSGGGGSGGGCGTTAPSPDDPAWPGMVMITMLAGLVLVIRKWQGVMAREKVKG